MERPSPDEVQPPVTRWGQVWRAAIMLIISATVWGTAVGQQWADHQWLFWLDISLGVPAFFLVFFRRRWPLGVAVALCVISTFSGLAAGPATLASASLATRRRWIEIAIIGVLNLVSAQAYAMLQPVQGTDPYWLILIVNLTFIAAMLGWGMYVGSRRELIWTLRSRAERAEAEQGLRVAQARAKERARIAREMHDVLAHRISQISLQAGALGYREDLSAEEVRGGAKVIQETAHEALTDLRGVLGVLRDGTGEPIDAPQPTYDDLERLVHEAVGSGLRVDYQDLLQPNGTPVPDVVGRTLYRIVQEGMTNARKHAPGALLSIRMSGSPEDGVDVLLRNPVGFDTGTPGAGLGLVGMAERAELRGGRLDHRRDGSTFVLHAWIPWTA